MAIKSFIRVRSVNSGFSTVYFPYPCPAGSASYSPSGRRWCPDQVVSAPAVSGGYARCHLIGSGEATIYGPGINEVYYQKKYYGGDGNNEDAAIYATTPYQLFNTGSGATDPLGSVNLETLGGQTLYKNDTTSTSYGVVDNSPLTGYTHNVSTGAGGSYVNGSGGTGITVSGTTYYIEGTRTYIAYPATGYRFVGWTHNIGTVSSSNGLIVDCAEGELVATANFEKIPTLTYDANGGTPTPAAKTKYGNVTLASAPTKGGFIFDGWLIDGTKYNAGATYNLQTDTTAVAQWRGFTVTVTRAAVAGTLSLYDVTAGGTVATESNGVLSYSGEVGHTYQVRCTVGADNFQMPAGIPGLDDDKFTPASGQSYEYTYSSPFYYVSLPAADEHGNSLAVTSPSARDAEITAGGVAYPAYSAGRTITIAATTDAEYSLVRAELFDSDGYSRAVYSTEGGTIVGDAFRVDLAALGKSFRVEPTYGEKHYIVSIAADSPSAAAFATLTATKSGGSSAQSETAGTEVVFAATMNEGYSFEGFYIGEAKVSDVSESGGVYSFTHIVAADVAVVAKASVPVTLSLSDPASATLDITYDGATQTAGTAFEVTLGESLSYEVRVTAEGKYFNGWYKTADDEPFPGHGISGTITPTAALDIYAEIGEEDPSAPVYATFAYANGCDATMGTFTVDGTEGPQTAELAYDEGQPPTVVLASRPTNGHLFVGWFADPSAQGASVPLGEGGVLTVRKSDDYYVKFGKNPHNICEWEGSNEPKSMTWRSKTYAASKPFSPSACRVDALGYPPGNVPGTNIPKVLELKVDMFSAPDKGAKPTASTTLTNIANQNARRLPVRRMERYMQVQVKCNREVDALLVGTSMEGLAV